MFSCSKCPERSCQKCPVRHLHDRGRPSDCEEGPATKKMRGEGDFVVKMEMEEVGKGVDQSTDSVEFLSFHNNRLR